MHGIYKQLDHDVLFFWVDYWPLTFNGTLIVVV